MTIKNTAASVCQMSDMIPLMREMRLTAMANELNEMIEDPNSKLLSPEEWIKRPFMKEYNCRCDKKTAKFISKAHLKMPNADMNDLNSEAERSIDLSVWERLKELDWIDRKLNLIITGPSGIGKTWFSCALAAAACERYMNVRFWSTNLLIMKLKTYKPEDYLKELNQISQLDLLILDDVGLMNYDLDSRYKNGSTIFTAAIPVSDWYGLFSDQTYAEAVLSRAIGDALRLEISGPDIRISKK